MLTFGPHVHPCLRDLARVGAIKRGRSLCAVVLLSIATAMAQPVDYFWANGMGCPAPAGSADAGYSTKVDLNGDIYVTGAFTGTVDFDRSAAVANLTATGVGGDIYVAKYDGLGNYLWAFRMGGTAPDEGLAMALAPGGAGIYVTGRLFQPSQDKAFLILVDPAGNVQWTKLITGGSTNCFVHGRAIAIDPAGNILLAGSYTWTVDLDPGPGAFTFTSNGSTNIYLAKYDAAGNFIWAISAGSTGTDIASGLAIDGSGDIYLAGRFTGTVDFDPGASTVNRTATSTDAVVAKYTSNGALVWVNTFGGTGVDDAMAVTLDPSGNVVATGAFFSTLDIDPGAGTTMITSAGLDDAFLVSFDASGNFNWGGAMGGIGADTGRGLVTDAQTIFVTGRFSATADMDPSASTASIVSVAASQDVFIAQYALNGSYNVAQAVGGAGPDVGHAIDLYPNGDVVITGPFWNTADFDPNIGIADLTSLASGDSYVARYTREPIPLPVELIAFAGVCDHGTARLSWSTATESNNDRFDLQRSEDLVTWRTVGSLAGAGASQQRIDYQLEDQEALVGTAYYRLRQVDNDGSSTLSNVIAVEPCASDVVRSITVLDESGRVIAMSNSHPQYLPAGLYLVRKEYADGRQVVQRFAVIRDGAQMNVR